MTLEQIRFRTKGSRSIKESSIENKVNYLSIPFSRSSPAPRCRSLPRRTVCDARFCGSGNLHFFHRFDLLALDHHRRRRVLKSIGGAAQVGQRRRDRPGRRRRRTEADVGECDRLARAAGVHRRHPVHEYCIAHFSALFWHQPAVRREPKLPRPARAPHP